MLERISNGWELVRQSGHVLRSDKELVLFPLLSGIACLIVMASFAVPLWLSGSAADAAEAFEEGGDVAARAVGIAVLFAFYFVNYFVIVFFNAALIACAVIRFKGGDPTLGDGFAAAMSRLPQIAGWAALAASVGVVLRVIESNSERVGQLVAAVLGVAWSIITYFVVPVIVIERVGPIRAAKRSAQVMKQTWGESLTANFGIGVIVFLATLVAALPIVAGGFAIGAELAPLGAALIGLGVLALILVSLVSSALNAIIVAALYLYATEGQVPSQFENALFREAFASR